MNKTIDLWRMDTKDHLCPFGLKTLSLLKRKGFKVSDHRLATRAETDEFKKKHHVKTTPQSFIDGQRIGGYEDVRQFLGLKKEHKEGLTYKPVVATFSLALLSALCLSWSKSMSIDWTLQTLAMDFIAFAMILLSLQKLKDLVSFSDQFVVYDLLAMRWTPYAYIYPFAEAYTGLGMLARLPPLFYAPIGVTVGLIGFISVVNAVYVDKRDLKCACVGGNSNVPLGMISMLENAIMVVAPLLFLAT